MPKTSPRISQKFGKTFRRLLVYLHGPSIVETGEIRTHLERGPFQILTSDETPDGIPGILGFARQRFIRDCEALKVAIHKAAVESFNYGFTLRQHILHPK